MTPDYPIDCVQPLCTSWWEKRDNLKRTAWCLAEAHVRHVGETPYVLEPVGRGGSHAGDHSVAHFKMTAFDNAKSVPEITNLPIAAVPCFPGEILTVGRGKRRPVLILAGPGTAVEEHLRQKASRAKFAPVYLVAPYYSVDSGGIREGFKPEFVQRVRSLQYTQFFWDSLPHERGHSAILRLDHIQPIEPSVASLRPLPWILSEEAQTVLTDAIRLHLSGLPPEQDSIWNIARQELAKYPIITE
ncbi:hypothetical protein [Desulfovibrio sp. 86]|uniref:Uncharacterized protein n=1 Tax=uncultured Desulfovibrio sp. TaxID=167968 RepID=A0A212KX86_9BACT|nr:hypothetical protein [Desulfovibrio sp. 86]SCM69911.1 conserved hypothetical protein [uncultured Desulfovibrio sp.]VZH35246.1 conserved protein of unknown function [Desulfovibrio sp. 86]